MPEISRFFGIIVYLYYADHTPPHFHAVYNEDEALIRLDTLGILRGNLPPRALGLVIEWTTLHRQELQEAWDRAVALQPFRKIEPLR